MTASRGTAIALLSVASGRAIVVREPHNDERARHMYIGGGLLTLLIIIILLIILL